MNPQSQSTTTLVLLTGLCGLARLLLQEVMQPELDTVASLEYVIEPDCDEDIVEMVMVSPQHCHAAQLLPEQGGGGHGGGEGGQHGD